MFVNDSGDDGRRAPLVDWLKLVYLMANKSGDYFKMVKSGFYIMSIQEQLLLFPEPLGIELKTNIHNSLLYNIIQNNYLDA